MGTPNMMLKGLLASVGALAICASAARADDAAYLEKAKAFLANVAAPVTKWDGPTSGPKSVGKKLVVIVLTDGRNGGAQGAADGAAEAAKALGWEVRQLDGQGSVPGRATALQQAIAMKPAGILNAGIDSKEQAPLFEQAAAAGIKVVGWHAGPQAGPDKDIPSVFTNVTTDPEEVADSAGYEAVLKASEGADCGVILFTDSIYAIATAKTNFSKAAVEGYSKCKVLEVADTPIGDLSNRMGQLTTSLLSKYGKKWTFSIAVNDLYYRLLGALVAGRRRGSGDRLSTADLLGRRLGAGVQAHSRQAISVGDRRRTAQPARLDHGRRDEPGARWRQALGLRAARAPLHRRESRQGWRTGQSVRSRQRLSRRIQEDLGREVARKRTRSNEGRRPARRPKRA